MIPKIGLISRTYRHINRYREIITVLVKHGFGDLVTNTNLEKYIDFGKKIIYGKTIPKIATFSRWKRIRMALEELGPAFIKFGQIMSNRPDLLPQELIIELEKLQDSVPPFAEKAARQLIEEELGKPISDLFKEFQSTPIASASIAQVHKAMLNTGETVVIKVQRPKIEQVIEVDLEIMLHLATLMEKHIKGMDILNPVGIVKEFERSIRKEIDFKIEEAHIERFGRNFQDDMNIYVPKVYRNYTTKKILTMEFIDGIRVSNIEAVLNSGNDPEIVASKGADLVGAVSNIGIWAEGACFIPEKVVMKTFTVGVGTQTSIALDDEPYYKFVIGGDYTFKNGIYLNAQYLHGFVHERGKDDLNDYLTFRFEKKFFNDELKVVPIGGAVSVTDWDDYENNYGLVANPEITYYPYDNVEIITGAYILNGKGRNMFSSLKDNDEVYFKAKVSF